jgi:HEAT repeat protein
MKQNRTYLGRIAAGDIAAALSVVSNCKQETVLDTLNDETVPAAPTGSTCDLIRHVSDVLYSYAQGLACAADAADRQSACEILGMIGDERSISTLINVLQNDTSDVVRCQAIHGLQMSGSTIAHKPLISALSESNRTVCEYAVQAVKSLKCQEAIAPLIKLLKSEAEFDEWYDCPYEWYLVQHAAVAIAHIGGMSVVDDLINILDSDNYRFDDSDDYMIDLHLTRGNRASAAQGLGMIGGKKAIAALFTHMQDQEPLVRIACMKALAHINKTAKQTRKKTTIPLPRRARSPKSHATYGRITTA